MTDREVMQQALEALESLQGGCTDHDDGTVEALTVWCPEVIDALRTALEQQAEPVAMRMPKVGDKVICLEDESLGEVVSLTAGGSPDITFNDGSRGTYLLREFAELFSYVAPPQQQAEPVSHAAIAGALFDFMGWLTTRKERLVLSSVDNASPAADAIKAFAEMRGLSLDDARVQDWNTSLPQQQAEPVFENLDYVAVVYSPSNAMLKSPLPIGTHLYKYPPQRQWVGLTGQEKDMIARVSIDVFEAMYRVEAKLKERNND